MNCDVVIFATPIKKIQGFCIMYIKDRNRRENLSIKLNSIKIIKSFKLCYFLLKKFLIFLLSTGIEKFIRSYFLKNSDGKGDSIFYYTDNVIFINI